MKYLRAEEVLVICFIRHFKNIRLLECLFKKMAVSVGRFLISFRFLSHELTCIDTVTGLTKTEMMTKQFVS